MGELFGCGYTPQLLSWISDHNKTLCLFITQCLKENSYRLFYHSRWKSCVTMFHNTTSCCKGFAVHKTSHFAHLKVFFCQQTIIVKSAIQRPNFLPTECREHKTQLVLFFFFCHVSSFFEISNGVLVLAGVEFIFIIAGMGLYFGFVLERITLGCFGCCWAGLAQNQGLLCSSPHPTREETGGT